MWRREPTPDVVEEAGRALREGRLVGIPTETVYGLAANALDPVAAARIFEAKERPRFDPLIVHALDIDAAVALWQAPLNQLERSVAETFWPGPLTLVRPRSSLVPDIVTSGLAGVAVRVPAHPVARLILAAASVPLAAPSANRFGSVSPTRAEHLEPLADKLALVVDGGPCELGVESTILSFMDGRPTVLRFGGVSVEDIEALIGPVEIRTYSSDRPDAPGQLTRHYATETRLRFVSPEAEPLVLGASIGLVVVAGLAPPFARERYATVRELSPSGDLRESAYRLFAELRELDAMGLASIDVIPCAPTGIGRAILDRLVRAAAGPGS